MMHATSLPPPVVEDCNKTTENICRVTFFSVSRQMFSVVLDSRAGCACPVWCNVLACALQSLGSMRSKR